MESCPHGIHGLSKWCCTCHGESAATFLDPSGDCHSCGQQGPHHPEGNSQDDPPQGEEGTCEVSEAASATSGLAKRLGAQEEGNGDLRRRRSNCQDDHAKKVLLEELSR